MNASKQETKGFYLHDGIFLNQQTPFGNGALWFQYIRKSIESDILGNHRLHSTNLSNPYRIREVSTITITEYCLFNFVGSRSMEKQAWSCCQWPINGAQNVRPDTGDLTSNSHARCSNGKAGETWDSDWQSIWIEFLLFMYYWYCNRMKMPEHSCTSHVSQIVQSVCPKVLFLLWIERHT